MENGYKGNPIRSYQDLIVYQNLYKAMAEVLTKIVPKLPQEEKYDLADQMRRASKAAPALIAEGFAKRYQKKNWQKYIDDTIGESNEMVHHLSVCIDIYNKNVEPNLAKRLIELYNLTCAQLFNLRKARQNFHEKD